MAHDTLSEVLDALRHDLGKYLLMPIAMLPRDASAEQLRAALHDALLRTQRGASTRSAEEIYAQARAAMLELNVNTDRLATLDAAVQGALRWQGVLDDTSRLLDRDVLLKELGAVRQAIAALQAEVDDE
jgi:hypothetical protein